MWQIKGNSKRANRQLHRPFLGFGLFLLIYGLASVLALAGDGRDPSIILPQFEPPASWTRHTAVALPKARFAYLDVPSLRPQFDPVLDQLSDSEFERWYLTETAFIAQSQLQLDGIRQSPLPVDQSRTKIFWRPPGWQRAGVLPLMYEGKRVGWIDIKGFGLDDKELLEQNISDFDLANRTRGGGRAVRFQELVDMPYSDGLATGGEAIAELSRGELIRALARREQARGTGWHRVIGTFAILDPGFEIFRSTGNVPAGMIHRPAHIGRQTEGDHTLFTAVKGGIQTTWSGSAVDFGGVNGLHWDNLNLTGQEVEHLRRHFFPKSGSSSPSPQIQPPWSWGHETFQAFVQSGNRELIPQHLSQMLGPLSLHLVQKPALPDQAHIADAVSKKWIELFVQTDAHYKGSRIGALGLNKLLMRDEISKIGPLPGIVDTLTRIPPAGVFSRVTIFNKLIIQMMQNGWISPDDFKDGDLHPEILNAGKWVIMKSIGTTAYSPWVEKFGESIQLAHLKLFLSGDLAQSVVALWDLIGLTTSTGIEINYEIATAPLREPQIMALLLIAAGTKHFEELLPLPIIQATNLGISRFNQRTFYDRLGPSLAENIQASLLEHLPLSWAPENRRQLTAIIKRINNTPDAFANLHHRFPEALEIPDFRINDPCRDTYGSQGSAVETLRVE